MGVSIPVIAELKLGHTTASNTASEAATLDRIVRALWKTGQLRAIRPEHPHEFWHTAHDGWYVGEHLMATPVTLPRERHPSASRELTVWVCEPTRPTSVPTNAWETTGTFVFLVEELAGFEWSLGSQVSGISSLRLAVEVVDSDLTDEQIRLLPGTDDRFSERVLSDPIEKLVMVGGVVGSPRPITAVYKIAYMNDEQGWIRGGRFLRTNDVLAYPLYIASQ